MSRRCQRKSVSGRTTNACHERRGSIRLSAASSSRSRGSKRGRSARGRRIDFTRVDIPPIENDSLRFYLLAE
jgi:hypothetical protein